MLEEHRREVLKEALDWVNAGFTGDPGDVRNWPVLDPLAPHVLALAHHGDEAGIAEPVARLYNDLGGLFDAKARYSEAEPLMRRALAIAEAIYGPDDPNVAIVLNVLASLLNTTNRYAEAEPLYRRALAITEVSHGPDHPKVAIRLNNLALLLYATNRPAEAEPLFRRAMAISEASYGPDDPLSEIPSGKQLVSSPGSAAISASKSHEIVSVARLTAKARVLDQTVTIDETLIICDFLWA